MARKKPRGSCPRHGTKYMGERDGAYYCACPTPNETPKICFYHPNVNKTNKMEDGLKYYSNDPNPDYQPDVLKVIFESWDNKKYITRQQNLM